MTRSDMPRTGAQIDAERLSPAEPTMTPNRPPGTRHGSNTPERLADLREILTGLVGHDNALIRSAVRIALTELDLADLSDNPGEHLAQVARILDAVLTPDGSGATA